MPRKTVLRVSLSLTLVTLLLWRSDVSSVLSIFAKGRLPIYLSAFAVAVIGVFLSTLKWRILLEALQVHERYFQLVRLYYIGAFFNSLLPGAVGGDVVRISLLRRRTGKLARGAWSVFSERYIGLGALWLLAVTGFVFKRELFSDTAAYSILSILFVLTLGFLFSILFPGAIYSIARAGLGLVSGLGLVRVSGILEKLLPALKDLSTNRTRILQVFALSVLFQSSTILMKILISKALALPIDVAYIVALSPIATTLAALPISIAGIGVREWGYVGLFAMVGVSTTDAVTLSLGVSAVVVLNSIVGGLVYLISANRTHSHPQ